MQVSVRQRRVGRAPSCLVVECENRFPAKSGHDGLLSSRLPSDLSTGSPQLTAKLNPHAPPGFREAFDAAREATEEALTSAVEGAKEVVCRPLDGNGLFGWRFEGTDPTHSSSMQGDLEYAKAYLRHVINQGFKVAFASWSRNDRSLVCLKSWEPGEEEPTWPRSTDDAIVWHHKPPTFTSTN